MNAKKKFPKNFWTGLPDMAIFENWVHWNNHIFRTFRVKESFWAQNIVASHEKLVFRSVVGFLFLFVLTDAIFQNSHIWELCRETFGFLGFLALAYNAESTYKTHTFDSTRSAIFWHSDMYVFMVIIAVDAGPMRTVSLID